MKTTFASEQNMDAPITIAHARLANLLDPLFEMGVSGAARLVMVGGRIDLEHATCSSDRNVPLTSHLVDQLALPDRPQSFRRIASCNISLASDRSATTASACCSRPRAASAAASRLATDHRTSFSN